MDSSEIDPIQGFSRGWLFREKDLVYLKVEDTVYCAPKPLLVKLSQVFRDMFGIPQGSDAEGCSHDTPIALPGCTKAEFEPFLDLILAPNISPVNLPLQGWLSVLRLAEMWDIPKVRQTAVREISSASRNAYADPLHPYQWIQLGKAYNVPEWARRGYRAYARGEYKSVEWLAGHLGWETAARIAHVAYLVSEKSKTEPLEIPTSSVRRVGSTGRAYGGFLGGGQNKFDMVLKLRWVPAAEGDRAVWAESADRAAPAYLPREDSQSYEIVLTNLTQKFYVDDIDKIVDAVFSDENMAT